MQTTCQFWKSGFDSRETMFQNAADFASQLPKGRVINISYSANGNQGIVCIWYWADDEPAVRDRAVKAAATHPPSVLNSVR
jgi:hypothetical protein